MYSNDPIGRAVQDFAKNGSAEDIRVLSDLCDEDVIPVSYLFRSLEEMPDLELKALQLCQGKVLDVGAAAGCHALPLREMGCEITAIDTSKGAIEYLKSKDLTVENIDFLSHSGTYDRVLILMNGIGIAANISKLPFFLRKLKNLLKPDGFAICDSSDLSYLYQEDDGSMWVDLNSAYHGEMQFQMIYKDTKTEWFNWIYIDFDLLKKHAIEAGLNCKKVFENEDAQHYLVTLSHL